MTTNGRTRVAIACQGGGSHTAFTAGVLQGALANLPADVEVVALSGTSGGAICAALAWEALVRAEPRRALRSLQKFWDSMGATDPWDQIANHSLMNLMAMRDLMVLPEISPYQLPTWGAERFRTILHQFFDFDELRQLARRPGAPILRIGAVEVLSGHFEMFSGEEICAECLEQELLFIEMLNRGLARGRITDPELRPMRVSRISMDRELNYRSKLDRRPEHLDELREFGRTKWRWFLKERETRVEQSSHKGAA